MTKPTYPEVCTASIKNIEKEIDILTSISGEDNIPAWMVKDLITKAHHQGTVDCHNMFTNNGEIVND